MTDHLRLSREVETIVNSGVTLCDTLNEPKIIRLVLPLPSGNLSPNSRCGWRAKAHSTAKYREAGYIVGLDAKSRSAFPRPWAAAEMRYRFFHRDSRRRDPDNLLASLKAAIDGIVDAGILEDDNGLIHQPVEQQVDRKNPRVELIISKREGE